MLIDLLKISFEDFHSVQILSGIKVLPNFEFTFPRIELLIDQAVRIGTDPKEGSNSKENTEYNCKSCFFHDSSKY